MRGEQFGRILGALVLTAKLEGCGPGTSEVKRTEKPAQEEKNEAQQTTSVETTDGTVTVEKSRSDGSAPSPTNVSADQDGNVHIEL